MHECGALRQQPRGDAPPQRDGRDHAEHGDQKCGRAYTNQRPEIGLEADVEEENEDANLGEDAERAVHPKLFEKRATRHERQDVGEADANKQLAKHRRLSPAFHEKSTQLRECYQDGDREQRWPQTLLASGCGPRRASQEDPRDAEQYRQR